MATTLCLGTVQFGQDYGIAGQKQPSLDYCVDCLDYATQNGISAIDTAEAYGTAQTVVGAFLKMRTLPRERLTLSTKFLPNALDEVRAEDYERVIRKRLTESLKILHTDYVDAYLFHSARYVFQPEMMEAMHSMVKEGLTREVGVSVYEPEEALACLSDKRTGLTQFPYSIFDQRMKRASVFEKAKESHCRVDTRSAFIQGLLLLEEKQVPPFLGAARPILKRLKQLSVGSGFSRVALAMAYVKRESAISHLVFGVDSLEQLKEDIETFRQEVPEDVLSELDEEFAGLKADIVMPSLWKK